jgi:heme exporter protein D
VNWGSWENFWAMGGYGLYVWGSYAMTAAVLAIEMFLSRKRRSAARAEARRTAVMQRSRG